MNWHKWHRQRWIEEIKTLAVQQHVSKSCIYSRLRAGWTKDEIRAGKRVNGRFYKKPVDSRYNFSDGQTSCLVLLYDVVRAITKLDEFDNYLLTVAVFRGLLERNSHHACENHS